MQGGLRGCWTSLSCRYKRLCKGLYIKKQVRITIEELGSISMPIAFTEYIASDIAILGRHGFFEAFEVTFREWERKLIIKPRT